MEEFYAVVVQGLLQGLLGLYPGFLHISYEFAIIVPVFSKITHTPMDTLEPRTATAQARVPSFFKCMLASVISGVRNWLVSGPIHTYIYIYRLISIYIYIYIYR